MKLQSHPHLSTTCAMLLAFILVLNMAAWFFRSGNQPNDAAIQQNTPMLLNQISLSETDHQHDETGMFVLSSLTAVLGLK
jgi:hypothetical protein